MSSLLDIGFLFFITLVFGCFSSRQYLRIFLIIVTIIYYLIGSGIIGSFLAKRISTTSTSIKNCIDTEGIILLGGGASKTLDGLEPGQAAYDRILKAAEAYQIHHQKIIISGGFTDGRKLSEAYIYAQELYRLGIPKKYVILDERSKNTYQNAEFVKNILNKSDDKYCLVTDGLHLKRSQLYFDSFRIKTVLLASSLPSTDIRILPSAYNVYVTQRMFHEYFGLIKAYIKTT
jgi:uncharacterized SAM-binding protein YcdF (DUF218 family)